MSNPTTFQITLFWTEEEFSNGVNSSPQFSFLKAPLEIAAFLHFAFYYWSTATMY